MAFFSRPKPAPAWPEQFAVTIDDATVSVPVRAHPNARSYRLTLKANGRPVLTVPPHGKRAEAEAFLAKNRNWLATRLARQGRPKRLAAGESVPLRGIGHLIVATGRLRGRVEVAAGTDGPELAVPGGADHIERRLIDWFKAEARRDLDERVALHAKTLAVRPTGLSLRGQSTRWGSCSSAGRLNFNWRLVLAPPFVLDYVAAHEVAHLVEMNHSPAFWQTVEKTLPDMVRGRAWLKANGQSLMGYGA